MAVTTNKGTAGKECEVDSWWLGKTATGFESKLGETDTGEPPHRSLPAICGTGAWKSGGGGAQLPQERQAEGRGGGHTSKNTLSTGMRRRAQVEMDVL